MSRWKKLPKVELHCHLEGCLRFSTLIEEAKRHGIILPYSDEERLRKYFLVEEPVENLQTCLEIMDRQGVVLADQQSIERMATEAVLDKFDEGVKLVEFRYAPSFIQSAGKSSLSFNEIHEAVKEGLREGRRQTADDIEVGLICTAIPALGKPGVEETIEFLLENRTDFVGFDMAGCEMKVIDYEKLIEKVHAAGIKITLHSGEERSPQSVNNVKDAIEHLHAKRIGHGVNIVRNHEVYDCVKRTKTHLEICPISNVRTNAVDSMEKHPIKSFLEDDLNISVNTDDPRSFAITACDQFDVLNKVFKFGVKEFFRLARNALDSSFVADEIKSRLFQQYFSSEAEESYLTSLLISDDEAEQDDFNPVPGENLTWLAVRDRLGQSNESPLFH